MKRSSESLPSSPRQQEKNTDERTKKVHMDELCSNLASALLIPQNKDMLLSHADQIEQATNYIVELKERVDGLNKRKEQLQKMDDQEGPSNYQTRITDDFSSKLPIIKVREVGTNLEVQLAMELDNKIMLHQVIRILEEEGAEVVNATFATSGNQVIHTLHAKARSSRVGIEASRVSERLHGLV